MLRSKQPQTAFLARLTHPPLVNISKWCARTGQARWCSLTSIRGKFMEFTNKKCQVGLNGKELFMLKNVLTVPYGASKILPAGWKLRGRKTSGRQPRASPAPPRHSNG